MSPQARGWLLVLSVAAAGAASPEAQPHSLSFRRLTTDDGLSSAFTMALAQDADGFVWIGTQQGLDRYDGVRVRSYTGGADGLPSGYVLGLGVAPDGSVVAGTPEGLARYDAGRQSFVAVAAPAGALARRFAQAPGVLWAGTSAGVLGLGRRADPGVPADTVRALAADGGVLFVASGGAVTRVEPGAPAVRRRMPGVTALAVAGGALWAGTDGGRLVRLDPARLRETGAQAQAGAAVSALVRSAAHPGWVWVGTRGAGLRLLDARTGETRALPTAETSADARQSDVIALMESGRTLWAATIDGVLVADVSAPRFRALGTEAAPYAPAVTAVHASRREPGAVWVGTVRDGLHRYRPATGRVERWFRDPGHPLSVTFAVHEAPDGALWLGGVSPSLWRFEPATGALREVPLAADPHAVVVGLRPARRPGHLWVLTQEAGLWLVDPDGRPAAGTERWRGLGTAWAVAEPDGQPGTAYAATSRGLVRLDLRAGTAEPVTAAGCDLSAASASVVAAGDVLWVGGFDAWLARLDQRTGDCRRYDTGDGLPAGGVGGLFRDGGGHLWINAGQGLARLDPQADVLTRFSAADGLRGGTFYFGSYDRTADGTLWLGSDAGLTAFHPDRVPIDASPPPVRLTRLLVDGEPLAVPAGELVLAHDRNDLAVEYAALDLRQPDKTRYRVRLVGADDAWRPSPAEVRYPLLPPGRYTLQVAATNRDGYWSEPTELAVRIKPPYYQTPWFWALVALAVGAVGVGAHRYRVEQLLRVERTRRRIADDLHDDIGSKMASVALRLDAARRADALPDDLRDRIGRLSDATRAVVGDLRDTVWLVDAERDDLRSVADRMERFAQQMLAERGAVERGPVPPVPLAMEARRDLYLLFTEAVHNAARHAEAERVSVRFGVEGRAFVLAVEDDGRGFDTGPAGDGRGLGTMRRRAAALGADLDVTSAPGAGTRVRLRLPL